jgi:hypothetical protein
MVRRLPYGGLGCKDRVHPARTGRARSNARNPLRVAAELVSPLWTERDPALASLPKDGKTAARSHLPQPHCVVRRARGEDCAIRAEPHAYAEMRTTLTLDDDLAELLKQRARDLGIPFKEAVNRTIRAGMGGATASRRHPAPKTMSHSFGFRPGIDLDKLGQLADELEAEAFGDKVHDSVRRKRPGSRAQR